MNCIPVTNSLMKLISHRNMFVKNTNMCLNIFINVHFFLHYISKWTLKTSLKAGNV